MMRGILLGIVLLVAACGGDEFTDCTVGSLTGTWRLSYDETNGSCGPIADETVALGAPSGGGCQTFVEQVSADMCRIDMDFACPTSDGDGDQRWTIVLEQVASDELVGTGTVQLNHDFLGTCRSTYDLHVTRL